MRCATCGTDNAPDSRFCGGCGARMGPPEQRLVPTAKIDDDATFPVPRVSGPALIPPPVMPTPGSLQQPGYGSHGPASLPPPASGIPPTAQRGLSIPPTSQRAPSIPPTSQRAPSIPPTAQHRPRVPASSMSESMPMPPKGSLGLIAIVLVIDLGLAAAGALMLSKGLGKDTPRPLPTQPAPRMDSPAPNVEPSKPVQKSETAAAAPQTAAALPPIETERIAPVETAKKQGVGATVSNSAAREARTSAKGKAASTSGKPDAAGAKPTGAKPDPGAKPDGAKSTPVTSPSGAGPVTSPAGDKPEDPYAAVSPEVEVNQHAARSKAAFDRCVGDGAAVHGSIQIAFQVLADGRVGNAQAVENSTGNVELARCLVVTIVSWRLSAHAGPALNFVRPFNYP